MSISKIIPLFTLLYATLSFGNSLLNPANELAFNDLIVGKTDYREFFQSNRCVGFSAQDVGKSQNGEYFRDVIVPGYCFGDNDVKMVYLTFINDKLSGLMMNVSPMDKDKFDTNIGKQREYFRPEKVFNKKRKCTPEDCEDRYEVGRYKDLYTGILQHSVNKSGYFF